MSDRHPEPRIQRMRAARSFRGDRSLPVLFSHHAHTRPGPRTSTLSHLCGARGPWVDGTALRACGTRRDFDARQGNTQKGSRGREEHPGSPERHPLEPRQLPSDPQQQALLHDRFRSRRSCGAPEPRHRTCGPRRSRCRELALRNPGSWRKGTSSRPKNRFWQPATSQALSSLEHRPVSQGLVAVCQVWSVRYQSAINDLWAGGEKNGQADLHALFYVAPVENASPAVDAERVSAPNGRPRPWRRARTRSAGGTASRLGRRRIPTRCGELRTPVLRPHALAAQRKGAGAPKRAEVSQGALPGLGPASIGPGTKTGHGALILQAGSCGRVREVVVA